MAAGIFCGITSKTTVQTVSATVQKIEVGTSWTGDKYTIVHAIDKETGNTYQYLANNLYVSFFPDVNAEDSIEITFERTKTWFGELNQMISITHLIEHIAESPNGNI